MMIKQSRYSFIFGSIFLPLFTFGVFVLLFFLYRPSQAAGGVFVVNNAADTDDGVCNAAGCTLREAINAANSSAGAATITFSLPPNATITLGGSQLPPISDNLTIDGSTAVNLTISGDDASRVLVVGPDPPPYPGAQGGQTGGLGGGTAVTLTHLTITEGNEETDRGGGIYNGGTLVIQNSTLSNIRSKHGGIFNKGLLTVSDSTFFNNKANASSGGGAGIFNDRSGVLTITNSTFTSNKINIPTAFSGAAIYNGGGGVSISGSTFSDNFAWGVAGIRSNAPGNLTIVNSTFSNNLIGLAVSGSRDVSIQNSLFTGNTGGALAIGRLTNATIEDTVFSNNSTYYGGGAMYLSYDNNVEIRNSLFSNNTADGSGGAIFSHGDVHIVESTFSNNSSDSEGGAIHNSSSGTMQVDETTFSGNSAEYGGAIQLSGGSVTVKNSTISGNSAQIQGGGFYLSSILTLNNTTISGNGAGDGGGIYNSGQAHVTNSIIANSFAGGDCAGNAPPLTNINNLIEDGSCDPAFSGDPLLGPLQDNGGPTLTHSPLLGSMAIDTGDAATCTGKGQRGVPRPVDGDEDGTAECDIGAVEKANFFEVNSVNDINTGICSESHCSLREAILGANGSSGTDVILFNIPGPGPHTIQPQSPLPDLTGPILIDGYTQPGAIQNTTPGMPGETAVMAVELDGTNAGPAASGLRIMGWNSMVRGLVINRFGGHGIEIVGSAAAGNVVAGNFIGTAVDGETNLGNGGANIFIDATASNNTIGGAGPEEGNIIAFAGTNGVVVTSAGATGNEIRGNAIFANGSLGIDLGDDGVTGNDPGDGDAGPNGLQNYPELFLATADFGRTIISGSLSSAPSTVYTLEFFANSVCDGLGNGEGKRPVGLNNVVTDGSGEVSFEASVPYETPLDEVISATATDPDGSSSEFSPCTAVVDAPITGLTATNSSPMPLNYQVFFTAIISSGGNVGYVWDFGDGAGGSGRVIYHQYPAEGFYTATVTASNSINMLTATTVVSITEFIPTGVSVTGFGPALTGAGGMVWPVVAGVVLLGIIAVVFQVRRRE